MRTLCKPVFNFSELSEAAKEKARAWYRETSASDQWYESVYEDVANIADILGIDIRNRKVSYRNGTTSYDGINIGFSGFSSQGDGAHFEGRYSYVRGAAKEIREYPSQDADLHRIADELQAIQRKNFYGITANVKHSGHYQHENCTNIEVEITDDRHGNQRYVSIEVHEQVEEVLRNFMRWIYRSLEKEYDFFVSNEAVDENIAMNGYEFSSNGDRSIAIQ
ncbi:MAG: hypothetical protein PHQ60_02330 [Sideroxydans sp.]|nr:hypothetical protein [Sideroxydans sp.]MDD5056681.1 hypothetical protein [Sideroxydans sp.]